MNLNDQHEMRTQLLEYIYKNPRGLRPLGSEMQIGFRVLKKFLIEGKNINFKSLIRVSLFLKTLNEGQPEDEKQLDSVEKKD